MRIIASPENPTAEVLESVWTRVAGRRLHARVSTQVVAADAPALVLVHGLGVSSRYWVPTARLLAAQYRVYAPDLPGSGKSDPPEHVLDIPELADVLVEWMDAVCLPRAVLVGNSLGCQVIVDLAVRYPERVESAIFVGPTVDPQARTFWQQLARTVLDGFREPLSLWPIILHDYWAAGPLRILRTFEYALRDPLTVKLPQMRTPTLVLRGERDPIVPTSWVEEIVRLVPHARMGVLPRGTHAAHFSVPDELVRMIRAFVDSLARTGEEMTCFRALT